MSQQGISSPSPRVLQFRAREQQKGAGRGMQALVDWVHPLLLWFAFVTLGGLLPFSCHSLSPLEWGKL